MGQAVEMTMTVDDIVTAVAGDVDQTGSDITLTAAS